MSLCEVKKDRIPAVGQLWKIGGITYRIDSLTGPDPQYPIEMREVDRDALVNKEIQCEMDAMHPVFWEQKRRLFEPRMMKQECAWFVHRADAVLVGVKS